MIENNTIKETVEAKVKKIVSLANIGQGVMLKDSILSVLDSLNNDEFAYLIKKFIQIYIVDRFEGNSEDIKFNNGMSIQEVRNKYVSLNGDSERIEGIWKNLKNDSNNRFEKYFFNALEEEFKRRVNDNLISTKKTAVLELESFSKYINEAREGNGEKTVLGFFQNVLSLKEIYSYQYLNEVTHEDVFILDESIRNLYKVMNNEEKIQLGKDFYFAIGGGVDKKISEQLLKLMENEFIYKDENQWIKEVMIGAAKFAKDDTNLIRKNNFIIDIYNKYLDSSIVVFDSDSKEEYQDFVFDVLSNAINLQDAASKIVKVTNKPELKRVEINIDTKELNQALMLFVLSRGNKSLFKDIDYLKDLSTLKVFNLTKAINVTSATGKNSDIYKDDRLSLSLKKNLHVILSEIYSPIFINVYTKTEKALNPKDKPISISRDYVVVETCGNEGVVDAVNYFVKNALLSVNNKKFEEGVLPLVDEYMMKKDVEKQNKELPRAVLKKF